MNDRGEIVLAILITLLLIAGGFALAIGVKCETAVQRCLDPASGIVKPEK